MMLKNVIQSFEGTPSLSSEGVLNDGVLILTKMYPDTFKSLYDFLHHLYAAKDFSLFSTYACNRYAATQELLPFLTTVFF